MSRTQVEGYMFSFAAKTHLMECPPAGDQHGFMEPMIIDGYGEAFMRTHPVPLVQEFHLAYGVGQIETTAVEMFLDKRNAELIKLRERLIDEEYEEFKLALLNEDPVETYDALLDLMYVVVGALISFKMPAMAGFAEVHRSNMSKLGADGLPVKNEHGKVMKGPNFSPPELFWLLNAFYAPMVEDHSEEGEQNIKPLGTVYANAEEFCSHFTAPGAKD